MAAKANKTNELIAKLKSDADEFFISAFEIDRRLSSIALSLGFSSLQVEIRIADVTHVWGRCDSKIPALSDKVGTGSDVKIQIFINENDGDPSDVTTQKFLHQLLDAVKAVWAKSSRNAHGGLNLKISSAENLFQNSVRNLATSTNASKLAVAYIDVDHFKMLNDVCGHDEGDKALRKVYAEMHRTMRSLNGLAFFDGGDEFILVIPSDDRMMIANHIWELREAIRGFSFGDIAHRIDITVGIVLAPLHDVLEHISDVKVAAESLTKNQTKNTDKKPTKRRGTINFSVDNTNHSAVGLIKSGAEYFLKLGTALSRSHQFVQDAFEDERLNLIAHQVEKTWSKKKDVVALESAVQDVLKWFGSKVSGGFSESSLIPNGVRVDSIPRSAIAIAVVHGIAKSLAKKRPKNVVGPVLKWSKDGRELCVSHAGKLIWGSWPSNVEGELTYGPLICEGVDGRSEGVVVGLQIGFPNKPLTPAKNALPSVFFAAHVRVDDRPRSGGGLPDFWQIALAQIISALEKSRPGTKIISWGGTPEDTEIYKRLKNLKSWEIDDVSSLTGIPSERIKIIATGLPQRVEVVKNSIDLLNSIYDASQEFTGAASSNVKKDDVEKILLHRPMTTSAALSPSEGVVCNTASLAYPIVIDTLRKSPEVRLVLDDSDQQNKQLLAFKVKLLSPLTDPVPSFLRQQQVELDEYARQVLLDSKGLIRIELEKSNQIEPFVSHLANYIGDPKIGRSTRRASLVVPHVPTPDGEPAPLGLTSVWATPRFEGTDVFLDFVFIWRTVEAFIGFPYSLYGSIRLAEQLLKQIDIAVGSADRKTAQIGEVVYIAMSLHLGDDEYHMRVAKQIVDSSSD
ncbi:GGDEF domain-containing protein [Herbaspirillum frisingense]|uniref:GGDEF domain-containing protein n=1 Tax=Herbaspirillum frisingense TaxID=92645 RepID=UPI00028D9F2A|nr:GGDEF domain-containing protein [Herbaspirillum frisingense]